MDVDTESRLDRLGCNLAHESLDMLSETSGGVHASDKSLLEGCASRERFTEQAHSQRAASADGPGREDRDSRLMGTIPPFALHDRELARIGSDGDVTGQRQCQPCAGRQTAPITGRGNATIASTALSNASPAAAITTSELCGSSPISTPAQKEYAVPAITIARTVGSWRVS
jgi:hypothetical protein